MVTGNVYLAPKYFLTRIHSNQNEDDSGRENLGRAISHCPALWLNDQLVSRQEDLTSGGEMRGHRAHRETGRVDWKEGGRRHFWGWLRHRIPTLPTSCFSELGHCRTTPALEIHEWRWENGGERTVIQRRCWKYTWFLLMREHIAPLWD